MKYKFFDNYYTKQLFFFNYKKILIPLLASLILYISLKYIIGLNENQNRFLSCIFFLIFLWTNEGLDLGIVSLLPLILFPTLDILPLKDISSNYTKPIIFLFLGGFFIAIATEKTNLHRYLAYRILSFFPATPRGTLYSVMITSGLLSSFLSDTTTTLLLMPIAGCLTKSPNLKKRLYLAVAHASIIGGIITPIGTPPNLILYGFMESKSIEFVSFIEWTLMMLPLAIPALFLSAEVLLRGLKDEGPFQKIEFKEKLNKRQKKVIIIFIALVILVFSNPLIKAIWGFKINEKILFLSFGLMLFFPKIEILNWKEDIPKVPLAIIFLIGASFSIASGFTNIGLGDSITRIFSQFGEINIVILIFVTATIIVICTEFTSNTGLSSIAIPIIYTIAVQQNLNVSLLTILVAVCASYAFMLPIATFPNAIVMSTGSVRTLEMIRRGFWLNCLNIILTSLYAIFYWPLFIK